MESPNYDFDGFNDDFNYRLALEHLRLHRLCEANPELITYEIVKRHRQKPHAPEEYIIKYILKSIMRVDEEERPIYGEAHELSVKYPPNFPYQEAECKMLTNAWHPNINSGGMFKGAICTNHKGFGSLFFLDELAVRIGEFLQYKRYLAENRTPWPEDLKVADWVLRIGEPEGIVDKSKGIYCDYTEWDTSYSTDINPEDPFDDIVITPRAPDDGSPQNGTAAAPPPDEDDPDDGGGRDEIIFH